MQDNEILILEELEKNSNITQRDLSEKLGYFVEYRKYKRGTILERKR